MADKKRMKPYVPVRLNILFFFVFLLFSALILRLGVVQIVQGEGYQEEMDEEVHVSQPIEAPRGFVYDRHGHIIVDNELLYTVTYTNHNVSQNQMLEISEQLNEYITLDTDDVGEDRYERERRDFWSIMNEDEFEEKLPMEEAEERGLEDNEVHNERLEAITDEEIAELTEEDWEVFMIWRELNSGYTDLPHKVKRGIDYEEAAQIMENIENLQGVDVIRDSTRKYPYGDTLRSVFGRVGPIPSEELESYVAQGYERNEEIGQSYLEQEYESVLRGSPGELENYMDDDGNFLRNPELDEGSRGYDLISSFDMELQQLIEESVDEILDNRSGSFIDEEDAYVVLMDPNTGDILSMYGGSSELGTFTSGYEAGSTIKGATVLLGFDQNVFEPGEGIVDRPIQPSGMEREVSSHTNMGYVDDIVALERSSNVYMSYVAMRMIGFNLETSTQWRGYEEGLETFRDYFSQFGLGVETQVDLPGEFTGFKGNITEPGNLLFHSFGQYDNYTPMQMAQYVSTIANDGKRVAPRVVSEIREPDASNQPGSVSRQLKPKVLNDLEIDDEVMDRVQEGFHRVIHGDDGTARGYFNDRDYDPAGKTGTAQVRVDGEDGNNQAFVGYAPFDEPEVAVSVLVPGASSGDEDSGIANEITEVVLDHYFDLQEDRAGPDEEDDPEIDDEDLDEDPEDA
ncbi:penicillin-binding transpeptidase domain-containing protein [Salisediminibacterium halotolerans]|uniref:serine-type D-Ala-D-Ala carboxypeptidase n=1 Tax=Salisediminibacterium halotolerans TaxID=517425 RepID=A0A1H9S9S4_9BACI|nr:penicillin-binding transpeptidase domain-containing protein [Salisediminibacterium haloalkalitolerans]SER81750.1 Cell division protein FtsI/penicillin-binding protein 2 [Salisediminibacterium haloalkalitolerans]